MNKPALSRVRHLATGQQMDPPSKQRPEVKIQHQELLLVSHQSEYFQIGTPPQAVPWHTPRLFWANIRSCHLRKLSKSLSQASQMDSLLFWLSQKQLAEPCPSGPSIPCRVRAEALGTHMCTGFRVQQDLVGRCSQNNADMEGWHKI